MLQNFNMYFGTPLTVHIYLKGYAYQEKKQTTYQCNYLKSILVLVFFGVASDHLGATGVDVPQVVKHTYIPRHTNQYHLEVGKIAMVTHVGIV